MLLLMTKNCKWSFLFWNWPNSSTENKNFKNYSYVKSTGCSSPGTSFCFSQFLQCFWVSRGGWDYFCKCVQTLLLPWILLKDGLVEVKDSYWFFFCPLVITNESCLAHRLVGLAVTHYLFPTGLFTVAFLMRDWQPMKQMSIYQFSNHGSYVSPPTCPVIMWQNTSSYKICISFGHIGIKSLAWLVWLPTKNSIFY